MFCSSQTIIQTKFIPNSNLKGEIGSQGWGKLGKISPLLEMVRWFSFLSHSVQPLSGILFRQLVLIFLIIRKVVCQSGNLLISCFGIVPNPSYFKRIYFIKVVFSRTRCPRSVPDNWPRFARKYGKRTRKLFASQIERLSVHHCREFIRNHSKYQRKSILICSHLVARCFSLLNAVDRSVCHCSHFATKGHF